MTISQERTDDLLGTALRAEFPYCEGLLGEEDYRAVQQACIDAGLSDLLEASAQFFTGHHYSAEEISEVGSDPVALRAHVVRCAAIISEWATRRPDSPPGTLTEVPPPRLVVGHRIVAIRKPTTRESDEMGWEFLGMSDYPTALVLDNGVLLIPIRDPEGNGPGVIDMKKVKTIISSSLPSEPICGVPGDHHGLVCQRPLLHEGDHNDTCGGEDWTDEDVARLREERRSTTIVPVPERVVVFTFGDDLHVVGNPEERAKLIQGLAEANGFDLVGDPEEDERAGRQHPALLVLANLPWEDLGRAMTCSETEDVLLVLRENGYARVAEVLLESHAWSDDEDDDDPEHILVHDRLRSIQ